MYLGPVPEFVLVNSATRRFSMAAGVEGKFLSSFLYWHTSSLTIFGSAVYELIACVRRANENARTKSDIRSSVFNKYRYILYL